MNGCWTTVRELLSLHGFCSVFEAWSRFFFTKRCTNMSNSNGASCWRPQESVFRYFSSILDVRLGLWSPTWLSQWSVALLLVRASDLCWRWLQWNIGYIVGAFSERHQSYFIRGAFTRSWACCCTRSLIDWGLLTLTYILGLVLGCVYIFLYSCMFYVL